MATNQPSSCSAGNGPAVFSRAAGQYNRVGPRHFTHFARCLVDLAAVEPGARILDVATGTGEILLAAAERSGADGVLVGVDLSEEMLAQAAGQLRDQRTPNVDLRVMDAQQLEFESGFDNVFCGFALDSLPDPDAALAGMAHALQAGGRLGLVEAPSWFFLHDPRWARQAEVFKSFGVAVGSYQPDRERDALVAALVRAGFQDIAATEEAFPLVFSDEDEWWAWMWSHGSRALLEAVPDEQLNALRSALAARLPTPEEDGTIRGRLSAHLIVAHRA